MALVERIRPLRRFSLQSTATNNAAANQVATSVGGTSISLPKIDPTQALRIIAGTAVVADAAQTGKLTVLGANVILATQPNSNFQVRGFLPTYGNMLLGGQGLRWGWLDDEYVYGSDYVDLPQSPPETPGLFQLQINADITNSDAVVHAVTMKLVVLVEIYQLNISLK